MSLNQAVTLLRGVYTCPDNTDRRNLTLQLLQWEKSLPGAEAVQVGLELLKAANEGIAVQAYGAVLLRHALHARLIQPTELPLMDLLSWYCNEPTLAPLLRGDLLELLVECVIYSKAQVVDQILSLLCTDADSQPHRLQLLSELTVALLNPNFDRVPGKFIGELKRAVVKRGSEIIGATTNALYACYVASGGEQSTALAPKTEGSVEAAFAALAAIAPQVPFSMWQEHNLAATLEVVLRWTPAQRQAVSCATSVLRSYSADDANKAAVLQVLLSILLRKTPSLVAARDIATLDDLLDLLLELPREFVRVEGVAVVQSLLFVFSLPSIQFADQAVQLMERLGEEVFRRCDPVDIYNGLRVLLPKNLCHPTSGANPEGRELSQEQFGFDRIFEDVFADFRRGSSAILTLLARLFPERTTEYLSRALTELPDPRGTADDPRTPSGFVQQSSLTFMNWEATQFMMECLSAAFESSSAGVNACVAALLAHEPSDAVLRPVFFNMISSFWRVRDDQDLNVWEGTITILLKSIDDEAGRKANDVDSAAARRRAHTLLVQICAEHSRRFLPLVRPLIKSLEPLLIRAFGAERSFLYEALVALTAVLPPQEADAYLQTVLNPLVTLLTASPALRDQSAFNNVICAAAQSDYAARSDVQGCLNTLAAVFRRCQMTPYIMEKATQLFSLVGRLLLSAHNIEARSLPPEFRSILDQNAGEKSVYLPGNQRRSEAHMSGPVRSSRAALMNIRIALYQIFGALSPILPAEKFAEFIDALGGACALPLHVMRALTEKCLLPIGKDHPSLCVYTFRLIHRFFSLRAEQVNQQRTSRSDSEHSTRDEVSESKQWFYFAKDVVAFMRNNVLDSHAWQRDRSLLLATSELAMGIFESGADNRTAERFLLSLVNLNEELSAAADVQSALSEVRLVVYARLVSYVTHATVAELSENERGNVCYAMSEPFIRLFPRLSQSLTMAGISQEQQDTLNAHLLISPSLADRRRKVKDFLRSIAAANLNPSV